MNDDAVLLHRYSREGSQEAFGELARRYSGLVYASAYRRLGAAGHLAGDVAQQVFLALAQRPPSLAEGASLAPWLYAAARHKALDAARAEQRRRGREEAAMKFATERGDSVPWERLRPELDAALDELPAADRDAVLLRFFAGESLAAVGTAMDVSEDAARKRVDRALDRLREVLARRGIRSTATALGGLLATPGLLASAPPEIAALCAQTGAGAFGATTAAGVKAVSLMSTAKLIVGASTVAALLASGAATREWVLQRRAVAALQAESLAYESQLAQAHAHARHLAAPPSGLTRTSAAAASPPESAHALPGAIVRGAMGPLTAEQRAKARAAAQDLMKEHPEVAAAIAAMRRAGTVERYGPFLAGMHLTSAQIDQFADIIGAASTGGVALRRMTPDGEKSLDFSSGQPPLTSAERDAQLGSLLGADGLAQFQEYNRNQAAWVAADMVARNAFDGGEPITADQRQRLVSLIARNSTAPAAQSGAVAINWAAVSAAVPAILNATQAQALDAALAQMRFNTDFTGGGERTVVTQVTGGGHS